MTFEDEKLNEARRVMQDTEKRCAHDLSKKSRRKTLTVSINYMGELFLTLIYIINCEYYYNVSELFVAV